MSKPDPKYLAITAEVIAAAEGLALRHVKVLKAFVEHGDYRSIQKALGLKSIGTVKSRLNRARAKLLAEQTPETGAT